MWVTLAGSGLGRWSLGFWYPLWVTEGSLVCEVDEGGTGLWTWGQLVCTSETCCRAGESFIISGN